MAFFLCLLRATVKIQAKSIEWFMEGKAFSPSHGLAPPPLSRPQVSLFLGLPKVELTDMYGGGGGGQRAGAYIKN